MSWAQKRVVVTGGGGFLGRHLVAELRRRGADQITVPRRTEYNLTQKGDCWRLLTLAKPEVVFHLAASVGGIGANQTNPGRFLYENATMGLHLLEECRIAGVQKVIVAGTVCGYPKYTPVPFSEKNLWDGYPEETNAPYGLAKKLLLAQAQAYRDQYGMNAITLIPTNLYGPHDNFDLDSSHVIPAMIRKLLEAKALGQRSVTLWGDGTPTREFLYVTDAAEAFVRAAEDYDEREPMNLGTGEEISMRVLAKTIAGLVGYWHDIHWNADRPNGQPRRCLDITRARDLLGWEARVSLVEGLRKTIAWYEANR